MLGCRDPSMQVAWPSGQWDEPDSSAAGTPLPILDIVPPSFQPSQLHAAHADAPRLTSALLFRSSVWSHGVSSVWLAVLCWVVVIRLCKPDSSAAGTPLPILDIVPPSFQPSQLHAAHADAQPQFHHPEVEEIIDPKDTRKVCCGWASHVYEVLMKERLADRACVTSSILSGKRRLELPTGSVC
jgi:hypothetical protein